MTDNDVRYCVQIHRPENRYRQWKREWVVWTGLCRTLAPAQRQYEASRLSCIAHKVQRHFRLIKCRRRAIDCVEVLMECQTDNGIAYDPRTREERHV